jgi:hypothetical protein
VRAWIPSAATGSRPRLHETGAAFGGLIQVFDVHDLFLH